MSAPNSRVDVELGAELGVDARVDLHTHSTLTDGTAAPEEMADAAVAVGLREWGLSDHVRESSDWVADYARRVRAIHRDGLVVRCGVEAKMLDARGRLDLPRRLPALDYVLVADHQFPSPDGPVGPSEVRRRLAAGETTSAQVVATLVAATVGALARSPFPPVVAHLFSLLPKLGLDEDDVPDDLLAELARGCRATAARVEINEKWRCPGGRVVDALRAAGIALVAGSDAHATETVGRWSYLHDIAAGLPAREPAGAGGDRAVVGR